MTAIRLRYGIPDIELPKAGGVVVNPADFAGHQLIVLFCPTAPDAAAKELDEYGGHAPEFCDNDAWIIGICADEIGAAGAACRACFSVAVDRGGVAWSAFMTLAKHIDEQRRESGAVFLFGRGGSLQRAWAGSGHANEVMAELKLRA